MAHPSELAAALVVLAVAAIAAALSALAFRSMVRTGNRRLVWVGTAFAVFTAKGLLVASSLWWSMIGHQHLELVSSLFDLAVVGLLAAPLLRR